MTFVLDRVMQHTCFSDCLALVLLDSQGAQKCPRKTVQEDVSHERRMDYIGSYSHFYESLNQPGIFICLEIPIVGCIAGRITIH